MFSLSDYRYHLPNELIAQEAIHPHHDARMMVIDKDTGNIDEESNFWNIDRYMTDDRVMFFNDSRVLRSRIILDNISYKKKDQTKSVLSDGEIFYLSSTSENEFEALVRPGNRFKIGTTFEIGEYHIEVIGINESGRILQISGGTILSFLEKYGALPLPPYIKYDISKESDYQTSFAKNDGSVAAPTASLHFTKELMEKITCQKEYITLHVGLGTFRWIQTPDIRDYNIHSEKIEVWLDIFQKITIIQEQNKKIVAVGTTAIRTLESLPYLWMGLSTDNKKTIDAKTCEYWNSITKSIEKQDWIANIEKNKISQTLCFETSIYIIPGYQFHIVDEIITNFHLGESSLLVLVSAFLWYENTRKIYEYAIKLWYRFYSFGDGMYIRSK
jgi:S-adenosylmethionine:tRNA ribosyltransferase-isomerase